MYNYSARRANEPSTSNTVQHYDGNNRIVRRVHRSNIIPFPIIRCVVIT